MTLPHIFGPIAGGTQIPLSFLDDNFNALGAMTIIPCTASGTNAIALTPLANTTVPSAYANYQMFGFVAANTTTGAVSAAFLALGARNVYLANGTTQAGSGDIVAGVFYIVAFNSALNGGAGGFEIMSPATNLTPGIASPVSTKTGDYTILTTDRGGELRMNSAAAHIFTLPAGAAAGNGFNVEILNINTGPVSLTAPGADKILTRGQQFTTIILPSQGDGGRLVGDGATPTIWSWKGTRSTTSTAIATNAATNTQAHSLQVIPTRVLLILKNAIAELGYTIGDEIPHPGVTLDQVGVGRHHQLTWDATNVVLLQGTTVTQPVLNKGAPAAGVNVTPGDWNWFWKAEVED